MAHVAIYARVSTDEQTTANQIDELRAWAARAGHEVVKVYEDKGISGAKGSRQAARLRLQRRGAAGVRYHRCVVIRSVGQVHAPSHRRAADHPHERA